MHLHGWEIALIVLAIILVFGVGKLSQVGGALGKSIREFRKEKDALGDKTQLGSRTEQGSSQPEEKTTEQTRS